MPVVIGKIVPVTVTEGVMVREREVSVTMGEGVAVPAGDVSAIVGVGDDMTVPGVIVAVVVGSQANVGTTTVGAGRSVGVGGKCQMLVAPDSSDVSAASGVEVVGPPRLTLTLQPSNDRLNTRLRAMLPPFILALRPPTYHRFMHYERGNMHFQVKYAHSKAMRRLPTVMVRQSSAYDNREKRSY